MENLYGGEVTLTTIREARNRISPFIHQTPLTRCRTLSDMTGKDIYFKLENMQKTGSFKVRGSGNKIYSLTDEERAAGVVSASAGNHAQGVAMAAHACGVPAIVVMPTQAPEMKIKATEEYGAKVVLYGNNYDEAYAHACDLQNHRGMTFVHAFDDEDVIAGQGTIALEILSKLFDVDAIVAPIGGGGLLAGLAIAAKEHNPRIQVIGVQAAGAPSMVHSLEKGHVSSLANVKTLADGIAVKKPGDLTFRYIKKYVDDVVLVTEDDLTEGILFMLERGKMITEGAGVAGVAAVLADKIQTSAQRIALVVSGGNIDPLFLSQLISNHYGRVCNL